MKWERTFEFSAPVDEVWRAFRDPDAPLRVMNPDNAYQSGGAVAVEFTRVEEHHALAWTETEGDLVWDMSVTFTEVETKTRITIVRSGFGDSDEWLMFGAGRLLGWEDVLADLEVYYRTGQNVGRLYNRRWGRLGLVAVADGGGLRLMRATGPGEAAGLRAGDVIVRVGGAPTVHESDLWLLESVLPDGVFEVEFVRGPGVESTKLELLATVAS